METNKTNKITIIRKYPQRVETYITNEIAACWEEDRVRKMALEQLLTMWYKKEEMNQAYASKLVFPVFEKIRESHPEIMQRDYKQVVTAVLDVVKKIEEKPKFTIGKTIQPIKKVIIKIIKGGQEENKITIS